jgi:Recombination endonuclease VII
LLALERLEMYKDKHFADPHRDQYREIMFALQGGRCPLCHTAMKLKDSKADHFHRTGFMRQTLCAACNTFEGKLLKADNEGDTVAVIKAHDAKIKSVRKPRGWYSYGMRANVIMERYWPMWEIFSDQAEGLRKSYVESMVVHGGRKVQAALMIACVVLVFTQWRGCAALGAEGGTGRILWAMCREKEQFMTATWKAVTPDLDRALRLTATVCEQAGLGWLADKFRGAA